MSCPTGGMQESRLPCSLIPAEQAGMSICLVEPCLAVSTQKASLRSRDAENADVPANTRHVYLDLEIISSKSCLPKNKNTKSLAGN